MTIDSYNKMKNKKIPHSAKIQSKLLRNRDVIDTYKLFDNDI